jgi:FhuF 2Fe-2S C-terminal domain
VLTPAEALTAAAAVGPYFVWEPWTDADGWRPVAELADRDVVADRVDAARTALITMFGLAEEDVPARVIASVTFLGLASRLLSPALGAQVLGGVLPAAELWWKPVPGGPWPFAYRDAVAGESLLAPVPPVLAAFQDRFALSPQVLWGNVASALAGAAGLLPDPERAFAVVAEALAGPPLAGMAELVRPDPRHARRFLVRNNCCLYYRIPGGGYCGDCVLTSEDDRRRGWAAALSRQP